MEYIDRIFYRKINPSDFKKLYDIDRPEGGGGQTYLEAAGISNDDIIDFLEYAEISDSPLRNETRSIYTFNAYVLGNAAESAFIEFAPRGGRNNYRISRQNMKYKHPAWCIENGFPEPRKNANGDYTSAGNFEGIIDNLVIMILRTTYKKYYVGFINSAEMPSEWPVGIGLERIFEGERRGVIKLTAVNVTFIDSLACPFGEHDIIARVQGGTNILLYGVPGSGKSWTIEHEYCHVGSVVERLVFHPDYTNADFIGQILPVVDAEKQVTYEFTPGPFTTILRDAYMHPMREYILIIEEVNRGNAPAIFGEVFQLLDRTVEPKTVDGITYPTGTSEYGITHKYMAEKIYGDSTHKVRIPSNLSIVGTMNTSDQNVFTLDTAFQRRWKMRLIENNFDNVRASLADAEILDTQVTWKTFCEKINDIIIGNKAKMASAEDKRLGVYFVHESDMTFDQRAVPSDGYTSLLTEYNDLLRIEATGDMPEDKKQRLSIIREALMHNRMFPEKVIKYLWDDAFKFNPEALFDTEKMESLEQVIRTFIYSQGHERFNIFKGTVREALYQNSQVQYD
ncbi:AAA family ATPase [Phascolarctobacterium faecium]|uniref:AAA family ATPase n=1 Tax=Phascolarctobacterium faecium TaxID=33025 RepID=UPI00352263FF